MRLTILGHLCCVCIASNACMKKIFYVTVVYNISLSWECTSNFVYNHYTNYYLPMHMVTRHKPNPLWRKWLIVRGQKDWRNHKLEVEQPNSSFILSKKYPLGICHKILIFQLFSPTLQLHHTNETKAYEKLPKKWIYKIKVKK